MSSESDTITDHEAIRKWAEQRGGKPAKVKGTGKKKDPGLLRIAFPDYDEEQALEEITWDEFFEKFEEKHLAFLKQDKTSGGKTSRFNKLVNREESLEH
jgi:hypothetical protein